MVEKSKSVDYAGFGCLRVDSIFVSSSINLMDYASESSEQSSN